MFNSDYTTLSQITFCSMEVSYNLNNDKSTPLLSPRVAHYGELAPECASVCYKYGCALLWKAQKATNPLANLPKKGTISKARTEERISLCLYPLDSHI